MTQATSILTMVAAELGIADYTLPILRYHATVRCEIDGRHALCRWANDPALPCMCMCHVGKALSYMMGYRKLEPVKAQTPSEEEEGEEDHDPEEEEPPSDAVDMEDFKADTGLFHEDVAPFQDSIAKWETPPTT